MADTKTIFDPRPSVELYSKRQFVLRDEIEVGGRAVSCAAILERLERHLTEDRVKKLKAVVSRRSFQVVTVLENIFDRGNVSAVMRSLDAFGFPRVHLIDAPGAKFKAANRVSKGSEKWLDVHLHASIAPALLALKNDGYRIYATHLDANTSIEDLDFTKPIAIVMGNEKDGVSAEMMANVDGVFRIPMQGFAQSFNISVATALILYHARRSIHSGLLAGSKEFEQVLANYYLRCFDSPEIYFSEKSN